MPKVEILEQKGHDFLWIDDELWMWDVPEERRAQQYIAEQAYGNVLVAGYGLGMVQKHLINNKNVDNVITIELHKEVIDACKKHYGKLYGVFAIGDFYKLNIDPKFDCVIGDIWSDIIPECLEEYKRFKKCAQRHLMPGGKIIAWGQELFEFLIYRERAQRE